MWRVPGLENSATWWRETSKHSLRDASGFWIPTTSTDTPKPFFTPKSLIYRFSTKVLKLCIYIYVYVYRETTSLVMRILTLPSFASTQKLDMVGKTNQHQRFIGKTLKEFRESETVPHEHTIMEGQLVRPFSRISSPCFVTSSHSFPWSPHNLPHQTVPWSRNSDQYDNASEVHSVP